MKKLKNVIKRGGHMEPFDMEKFENSIKKAMIDARLIVEELKDDIAKIKKKVLEDLGNKDDVDVSEIRLGILRELEAKKKEAAFAWRNFDKKYKSNY